MTAADVRRQLRPLWRVRADVERAIRRPGNVDEVLDEIGIAGREDLAAWHETTSVGHERYRERVAVPSGIVTVMCVSRRPDRFDAVVDAVRAQVDVPVRLVFVANDPGFDVDICRSRLADESFASDVLAAPVGASLGAGLNLALAATSSRWVAKFDDDDLYGPHHLADSLRALRMSEAGLVGKHSYYADLLAADVRVVRFPGKEFTYSGTLAGGTLVIDRERVGGQRFDDLSLGEDRAFITACHRRGISTFSGDRFNFVQVRGDHNTWRVPDDLFLRDTVGVELADPAHTVDR